MSRYHSYLNTAAAMLGLYKGEEPFAAFSKKYFAKNKKPGSGDRKQITHLCYCFFRFGKAATDLPVRERIIIALWLCSAGPSPLLQHLEPKRNETTSLDADEKLLSIHYRYADVFPWSDQLSGGIEYEKFCASFFIQPDLFLRIRTGYAKSVLLKLSQAGIEYEFISPFAIRLPNSFKADQFFELDKEVVVQDYNSQQIAGFLPFKPRRSDRVWDCCAGSGGKSIMAFDLNPAIDLVVSDIRESILVNLKKRFERAGITAYKSIKLDLNKKNAQQSKFNNQFSVIITDVPCTGSGTWSRTPEQLYYFNPEKINEYAALQKRIVSHIIPHLQPGGHLLYITCSVFKKENEEIIEFLEEQFHLRLLKMELLKGYTLKADTMFAALLQKPL